MREGNMMRRFSTQHGGTSRKLLCTLAVLACLGGMAAPAHAFVSLRGYMSGIPTGVMTSGDWSAFQAAAQKLLGEMPSTLGQQQDWKGPSGASGTLTIERIYEKDDMPCRTLGSVFNTKTNPGTYQYKLNMCRDPKGEWKILS
jgi:surface antigen